MSWQTQTNADDVKVQVSGDYSRSEERTDFLIIDKDSGEHNHLSQGVDPGDDLVEHHDYQPSNK